jgi:protein gp37
MGNKTGIEWTDATWNPLRGCTHVSEGCRFCYAERVAARFSGPGLPYEDLAKRVLGEPRWTGKVRVIWPLIDLPLRWRRPQHIFVNSMSDHFHEGLASHEIASIYAVCVAAVHLRGHTMQILTKRAERAHQLLNEPEFWGQVNAEASAYVMDNTDPLDRRRGDARATLDDYGPENPPPGVWLGVSVENQAAADERIPLLLQTPAAKRFLSCEPLLGPVKLDAIQAPRYVPEDHETDWKFSCLETGEYYWFDYGNGINDSGDGPYRDHSIDWVIVGGESGRAARPMHPQWARDIRDECAASGVPFFFKQWGEWTPGENIEYAQKRTETGAWFDDGWRFQQISPRVSEEMHRDDEPDVWRVRKKAAGAFLDGIEHKAFPENA